MADPVRVAVGQLATGTDLDENLATCQRVLRAAGEASPQVVVLPEFVNHVAWYDSPEHAWSVAVDLDGPWVKAFGETVAEIGAWTQINVTLRRGTGHIAGANLVLSPDGSVTSASDKQVLMGNENNFLTPATEPRPVLDTPFGPIGPYACMEGVICETARSLAVRGARLLLNSLNSFALDEASLHIPVRAPENRVFVAAANKVGPIVPPDRLEEVAAKLRVDPRFLHGGGESQVIAPDGSVLVQASRDREEVVWADVDLDRALDKRRPDGTDVFAVRRPELYRPLAMSPDAVPLADMKPGARQLKVAVVQPAASDGSDAPALVEEAVRSGAALVVLPELHALPGGATDDPATAALACHAAVAALQSALDEVGGRSVVATSIVERIGDDFAHTGVLVDRAGIVVSQRQLHRTERHPWVTVLGDGLGVDQRLWGRCALVVGDDAVLPETVRLAGVSGAEVVAVPFHAQERWETELGLVERAAENRVNLVAATRPSGVATSLVVDLPADFTLWVERDRPFDGNINVPDIVRARDEPGLTMAVIHPAHAANKLLSHATDLVNGRPWGLLDALVR